MSQQTKLRQARAALPLAIAAIFSTLGSAASAAGLKAESASAAVNPTSQYLAATIKLRNTSKKTVQAFIMAAPSATDDAGNTYDSTSLSAQTIGGISVCSAVLHCLTDDKEKTENSATVIDPDEQLTLTVAFCCKASGATLPTKASAGIILQARESADGQSYGAWHSVSVGVSDIAVKGGK